MTGYHVAYLCLLAAAAVFAIIAILAARGIRSPREFFHHERVPANVVSLVVANVTLGTGVAYYFAGVQSHGILMVLVPISVCIGYLLLASTIQNGTGGEVGQNLLRAAQAHLDRLNAHNPISLARTFTICLVIVFSLALSYELIASPAIIAPFIVETPSVNAQLVITAYLFLVALMTILFGGVRGVFRTDWIQLVAVIIVVVMLVWTVSGPPEGPATQPAAQSGSGATENSIVKLGLPTLVAVAMACIAAVATQFYSLLNWTTASHVQARDQARIFRTVGILSGTILLVFVVVGLVAQQRGQGVSELIAAGYKTTGQGTSWSAWVVCGLVAFGLASIVCSTADSLMIAVTQFAYDNILGGNSGDRTENRRLLRKIRLVVLGAFALGFGGIVMVHQKRLELFTVLLAMASGVATFAPACWLLLKLVGTPERLRIIQRWVVWFYAGVFFLAYAVALPSLFFWPQGVPYLGVGAFAVSLAVSWRLWRRSARL